MKYNVLGHTGLSEQLLERALQDLKVNRDERGQLNTVFALPAE